MTTPLKVVLGKNGQKLVVGKGNISLRMENDQHIKIIDVYYVPEVTKHIHQQWPHYRVHDELDHDTSP